MKAIKEYDHIISLGLNCEVSYQMRMKHGVVESHLLSWAAVHSNKLIDIINNPHILFSGEIRDLAAYNMWECASTKVAFHGKRPVNELKNADGSRNMEEVAREKEEVISRVKYLCDKFNQIGKDSSSKLYCLGLQPAFLDCSSDELRDFCTNVHKSLIKNFNNSSLLVIAESHTEWLSDLDNNTDFFVRFISKCAPYNKATYPEYVDLCNGGKIFEEFRTRFSTTQTKVYKFER